MRTAFLAMVLALPAACMAWAQATPACPGGREISGFALTAQAPEKSAPLTLDVLNDLDAGDTLRYAPYGLPPAWRKSAQVAVLLVPGSDQTGAGIAVFQLAAGRSAVWRVNSRTAAVAFLFGPNGLNAARTRSLLDAHPELVARLTQYATQASRVEALVTLFWQYEQSPPGSLNLDDMLKAYAAEYGVAMPKLNPALSPDEQAEALLAAVAPPTSATPPSSTAALRAGGTSTATAIASLYFGPEVGFANDTVPLFRALHQSLFPGIEFQGAFAQPTAGGMDLCTANAAAPAQKHPVYIWMIRIPGGPPPVLRLARGASVTVPAGWNSSLRITGASVAQLYALPRARSWQLVSAAAAVPVPVTVAVGAVDDTLALDLRNLKLAPGTYKLAAMWDWTPVAVAGSIDVRAVPSLASIRLAPGTGDRLVAGGGTVPVDVTGADFSFVDKVELVRRDAAADPVQALAFTPPGDGGESLAAALDTAALQPGAYALRVSQITGGRQDVPVTIHPPNPSLDRMPVRVNLGESSQPVLLHGRHLELISRITSADASWNLAPAPASGALEERAATVTLSPQARQDQTEPVDVYVAGMQAPLVVADGLQVLGPRPRIRDLTVSLSPDIGVELRPGELPAGAIANFGFVVDHAPADPAVVLSCNPPETAIAPVTLHPGVAGAAGQDLEAGGDGLFYLALTPGGVGDGGCELRITVTGAGGSSDPGDLGRIVRLPHITRFTLSDQGAGPALYQGELTGDNLQLIARTGWSPDTGVPVAGIPMRSSDASTQQTLAIVMPWPPPSPHAPLYIWLRGETQGRKTTVTP